MDWQKRFNGLDLYDEIAANKQVDSIAAIQQNIFVTHGYRHLHLKRDLRVRQLTRETLAIGRFEQARPEGAMHLDCASNHTS